MSRRVLLKQSLEEEEDGDEEKEVEEEVRSGVSQMNPEPQPAPILKKKKLNMKKALRRIFRAGSQLEAHSRRGR